MNLKNNGAAVLLAGSLLALAGCSSATGIADLDRAATEADRWPGDPSQLEGLDRDSARLLATHGGARYFAVSSQDQQVACLFKFAGSSAGEAVGGCGGVGSAGIIVDVTAPSTRMMLVRSDADLADLEEAGWTRIHENVLIF